jgi:hypothetical protein
LYTILDSFPEIEWHRIVRPGKQYGRRLVRLASFQGWFEARKVGGSRNERKAAA